MKIKMCIISLLALVLLFSCTLPELDRPGKKQTTLSKSLVINVNARTSRAITVNQYHVVSLAIEVFDTDLPNAPIGSINWNAVDGTNKYEVKADEGEYEIVVTHICSNGYTVQESSLVTIEPYIVTEVEIIPGNIGVINISQSINQGLVAYYPFNGDASDKSGNTHDAQESGGVQLTCDRNNNSDSACLLDGINDYLVIDHHNDFNFALTNFAISLWIKSDTVSAYKKLFDKREGQTTTTGFGFQLGSSGNIQVGARNTTENIGMESAGRIDDGLWHHIVISMDVEQQTSHLYIDGVLQNSGKDVKFDFNNSAPIYLGCRFTMEDFFKGAIDDLRIYNRSLTADEIGILYQL